MEQTGTLLSPLLWIIFLVAALASAVFCLIFYYHWIRFSANPVATLLSIAMCVGGCLFFLTIMLGAIAMVGTL